MTKKKLMALDLGAAELLDKENQLVFEGNGSGSGSGSQNPSGTLVSNSGEEVFGEFFAPIGTTFIEFRCIGKATPLPVFTCKTKGLSDTWHTKTKAGIFGAVTTIDVSIDASNIYIAISLRLQTRMEDRHLGR